MEIERRAGGVESCLRRALHDVEPTRRWGAAFTTARVEPPSPKLLPALVALFLERALAWKQDTDKGAMLVFPNYVRLPRPAPPLSCSAVPAFRAV